MQSIKRHLFRAAALGSALIGGLAVAAPASANSFGPTDYGTDGRAMISYDDARDLFCIESHDPDGTNYYVATVDSDAGPSYGQFVRNGLTDCVSFETAYEDSKVLFEIMPKAGEIPTEVTFYS